MQLSSKQQKNSPVQNRTGEIQEEDATNYLQFWRLQIIRKKLDHMVGFKVGVVVGVSSSCQGTPTQRSR